MQDEYKNALSQVLEPEVVENVMAITESVYGTDKLAAFAEAVSEICDDTVLEAIVEAHCALFEGFSPRDAKFHFTQGRNAYVPDHDYYRMGGSGYVPGGAVNPEARHYGAVVRPNASGPSVAVRDTPIGGYRGAALQDYGRPAASTGQPSMVVLPSEKSTPEPTPVRQTKPEPQPEKQPKKQPEKQPKKQPKNQNDKKEQLEKEVGVTNQETSNGSCSIDKPFVIHVISMNSEAEADKVIETLKTKGISAYKVFAEYPINSRRRNVWRVRIGHFGSRDEAIKYAQQKLKGTRYGNRFDPCTRRGWWIDKCENDNGITQDKWKTTQKTLDELKKRGGSCPIPDQPSSISDEKNVCRDGSPIASNPGAASSVASGEKIIGSNVPDDYIPSGDIKNEDDAMKKRETELDEKVKHSKIGDSSIFDGQFNTWLSKNIDTFKKANIPFNENWYITKSNDADDKIGDDRINTLRKYGILAARTYISVLDYKDWAQKQFRAYPEIWEEIWDSWGRSELELHRIISDIEDEVQDFVEHGNDILEGNATKAGAYVLGDGSFEDCYQSIDEINDEIRNIYEAIEDTFEDEISDNERSRYQAALKKQGITQGDIAYVKSMAEKLGCKEILGEGGKRIKSEKDVLPYEKIRLSDDITEMLNDHEKQLIAELQKTEGGDAKVKEITDAINSGDYEKAKELLYGKEKQDIATEKEAIKIRKETLESFIKVSNANKEKLGKALQDMDNKKAQLYVARTLVNYVSDRHARADSDGEHTITAEEKSAVQEYLDHMKNSANSSVEKANSGALTRDEAIETIKTIVSDSDKMRNKIIEMRKEYQKADEAAEAKEKSSDGTSTSGSPSQSSSTHGTKDTF